MSEAAVRGLIIAHSSLAQGLVSAVRQISGADEQALQPLSNEGRGPEGLVDAVEKAVGDAPAILFTDLGSGSCAFAARRVALQRPSTAVVCGANLAVLLDFVFHREMPLPELVDRLVEKGRSGITGTCTEEDVDADRAVSGG
jgi:mannose/fructose-specific phosphotransferase system component IIA